MPVLATSANYCCYCYFFCAALNPIRFIARDSTSTASPSDNYPVDSVACEGAQAEGMAIMFEASKP